MNDSRESKRKNILHRQSVTMIKGIIFLNAFLLLVSCAPSLYSVNIKYEPSRTAPKPTVMERKYPITIAVLNDARPAGDDLSVGRVVTSGGNQIPIIPRNLMPAKALTASLRDYMLKAGYTLTDEMPAWNLQENAIKKEWGRILIGGKIDTLEIVCNDKIPIKKYRADVKLSLFFADVQKGKIFYTISAAGSTSLEHVRFSEEILEQQINGALSYAIEDIFAGNTVQTKIQEILRRNP